MSAVASQKLGPEVLLIFLGHSSDADALADAIYDLERDLQRLLDQHLSVSAELPFKSVRIWEWRKDGLPVVGGQDQVVAEAIKRANIAVFVFKERIGSVSWDELNQSRNKENPTIPVLAFFPTDSPPDLNDEDRIAKWLDLVKKRGELVRDWSAPNSKALRPMEKYKDAAHLTTLAVEQLSNAVVSLLKCDPAAKETVPAEVLPTKFLGDHSHLSYDRQPVLTRSLDELDQDLLKELLAKPLSQDLNADLKRGRDGSNPAVSEQLENLGCLYAGRPTLGALLCFAPAQLLTDKSGCCTLQMAIHDGSERGGERAPLSLARGNLLLLYKKGMSWLTGGSILRRRGQIGTDTRDDLEIPEIVLREALANALVHRDYETKVLQDQPTRIDVYPDKVEITSYGLLLKEVSIELLNSPNQNLRPFRRNPVIAGIFQCMTLAELNASGVQRMRRVMTSGGLAIPLFRTSDDFVCVTLARPFDLSTSREPITTLPAAPRSTRKAFISSTGELMEHRKAAQDACLRAGVIPIVWEELQLTTADTKSTIKHMIDYADLYICILGTRYGSVSSPEGISFTELEFNRAVEKGLPILVFSMHKDHPVTIAAIQTDQDGRQKLQRFKERVAKEHLFVEFKSPEDLRNRIITALAALPTPDLTKRFRVAFSFAGEKRDFVAKVAALLALRFGENAILYDKYHEAEFARTDLAIYLPELYENESELVVVIVSPDYEEKVWCGLEWSTVNDLLEKPGSVEIMLGRFGRAATAGVYQTAGFIELDEKTPEQAANLILERLAVKEGKPKDSYLTATPLYEAPLVTAIPNNLPRLQPFFGREKELATIREALAADSRTWGALIDGPGGMGKTSLAVRAAYDCPPGQFQRIIFLSVNDREMDDDGVRALGNLLVPGIIEMLNELARELGHPEIAKAPEDQRIRLLLDELRSTRALLILDNLESLTKSDRDQLFSFVKRLPHGCKAILTSRRRIGSSADTLILEKLDQKAAMQMLEDIARRNPLVSKTDEGERRDLYVETGGKPLLLRWVAGQLGRGSCRTFNDALQFLRNAPSENDPLEFIFGDLAQDFTLEETKVLGALSYFTQPAKVAHIAELAEVQKVSVDNALRSLANRSLVVPDQEEQAYALVPMVADFLRRHRPDVVAQTGTRLAARAYTMILENGYEKYDLFPMLDLEWATVAPALLLFVAGPNERLQTICAALRTFLEFTGRWDELLSLNQQAEFKAVATGDHDKAGWRAYQAGVVYHLRGQADEVLACAERAETHWQRAGAGPRERAVAIQLRGFGQQLKADYPAAITAYRESLDLHRAVSSESLDVAVHLNDLANAEANSGDFAAAERDYMEALRVARAVDYTEGIAAYTGNLAALAGQRNDWPHSEALTKEALMLAERLGRQDLIAGSCHRLALALQRQGKSAEALQFARRAVEIYAQLASPKLEASLTTLRECESSQGQGG